MSESLKLWELAGDDPQRVFSPYVWRVRLTLFHKQIPYESVCWRYADKELIKPSQKVPVLDYRGQRLNESYKIVKFLEKQFPGAPQILKTGHPGGGAYYDSVDAWFVSMTPKCLLTILFDVFGRLAPQDKAYFRESREEKFGATLEEIGSKQGEYLQQLREGLQPARAVLADWPYLNGSEPGWFDICLLAIFLWARAMSPLKLLEGSDPLFDWRKRLMAHYHAAIEGTVGCPVE